MDLHPFIHASELRIVICTVCKYAYVAEEVAGHLRKYHKDVSVANREAIAAAILQLDLFQSQA
ncbi:hypothetical protein SEPCBS57363_006689, partial [Sporothrix epigloea]